MCEAMFIGLEWRRVRKKPLKDETETSELLERMKEKIIYPPRGIIDQCFRQINDFYKKGCRSKLSYWPYLGEMAVAV